MQMRITVATAFVLHALLGGFCTMMPMAMAAEMPTNDMTAMEDVMTPIAPMSHADCADCPHHQEKREPAQQSSCAGHCLSSAHETNLANIVTAVSQIVVALPAKMPIIVSNEQKKVVDPLISVSPPPIPTSTVVLTL